MSKTLRQMVEELVALWESPEVHMGAKEFGKKLRAILAATEPGEWRGPWKCSECGDTFDVHPCVKDHFSFRLNRKCTGTLVPYERRQT